MLSLLSLIVDRGKITLSSVQTKTLYVLFIMFHEDAWDKFTKRVYIISYLIETLRNI